MARWRVDRCPKGAVRRGRCCGSHRDLAALWSCTAVLGDKSPTGIAGWAVGLQEALVGPTRPMPQTILVQMVLQVGLMSRKMSSLWDVGSTEHIQSSGASRVSRTP